MSDQSSFSRIVNSRPTLIARSICAHVIRPYSVSSTIVETIKRWFEGTILADKCTQTRAHTPIQKEPLASWLKRRKNEIKLIRHKLNSVLIHMFVKNWLLIRFAKRKKEIYLISVFDNEEGDKTSNIAFQRILFTGLRSMRLFNLMLWTTLFKFNHQFLIMLPNRSRHFAYSSRVSRLFYLKCKQFWLFIRH